VTEDRRHRSFLQFVRKALDVPMGFSKSDLIAFRSVASKEYASIVPLVEEYLRLAESADTDVVIRQTRIKPQARKEKEQQKDMHLFDLLREKSLFPDNRDLREFAGRVIPNMDRKRFEKISKTEIVARIVEYVETRDRRTRDKLEASMRDALMSSAAKKADRKSFFSKWENIIKGIQL
jgi:hypothetical protein